jgi:intracellular sulfur oxidation DsrE/DsrF family protein
MNNQFSYPAARRSFLASLNSRVAALGAMIAGSAALSQGKTKMLRWEPARHEQDDWLDKLPGKHRLIFDTTTREGFGEALAYAGNFMRVNKSDYGLEDSDLAVVIVARHHSTPFAYNDAMWAKYGAPMAALVGFDDPKTKEPPTANIYNSADRSASAPNRGTTVDSLLKRGVQLAVCATATRAYAGSIAKKAGGTTDGIQSELIANLLSNSRMVPAGIVAVSRAQERGYSMVKA